MLTHFHNFFFTLFSTRSFYIFFYNAFPACYLSFKEKGCNKTNKKKGYALIVKQPIQILWKSRSCERTPLLSLNFSKSSSADMAHTFASESGSQFTNQKFQQFSSRWESSHGSSSPYHPTAKNLLYPKDNDC